MKAKFTLFALAFLFAGVRSFSQTSLLWVAAPGSTATDKANAIAVDAAGNSYTTGYFKGTCDFDPGTGVSNLVAVGFEDIFVCKLDPAGNLVWAKSMGGASTEIGNDIAIDTAGNVYVTGYFWATVDFDPGAGVLNLASAGSEDAFIEKLDPSGNMLWAKRLGAGNTDISRSITVDKFGNVITTGTFKLTVDMDPGAGTANFISAGQEDVYIHKLDAAGNFVFAKQFPGTGITASASIAVDSLGNIYSTGWYNATCDFDPGTGTTSFTSTGGHDIYISKLGPAGNFIWAKTIGENLADEVGNCIVVDDLGYFYLTGLFHSTCDFDPGAGTANMTAAGNDEIYVCKYDTAATLVWTAHMGGTDTDVAFGVATDAMSNVYVTGYFTGPADFDPGVGTYTMNSSGVSLDIFVCKLDNTGAFTWAIDIGSGAYDWGYSIALDAAQNVYTTGYFTGIVDFDPGAGTHNVTAAGLEDIFILKLGSSSVDVNNMAIENDAFRLFPNPARDKITLQLNDLKSGEEYEIKLYNSAGQLVYSSKCNESSKVIDLAGKAKGIYLMKVDGKEISGAQKIVVD